MLYFRLSQILRRISFSRKRLSAYRGQAKLAAEGAEHGGGGMEAVESMPLS